MSSRREVLIRIVALLQRKTLLETKNRTLNGTIRLCDKWKMLQYWRRTGHLPSFFVLTPGDLTAKESPPPGICYPRQKNLLMPGGQPGGGGGLGAAGIDWCINEKSSLLTEQQQQKDQEKWTHILAETEESLKRDNYSAALQFVDKFVADCETPEFNLQALMKKAKSCLDAWQETRKFRNFPFFHLLS